MSVLTRVYQDYASAKAAEAEVEALGLSGVEVSLLGSQEVKEFQSPSEPGPVIVDPATGLPIETRPVDPNHVNMDGGTGTVTGAGVGAAIGGGAGLLAGLGMLAIPGIGPLVAAGWLAATAVGAAGGALAGGALGAIADIGLSDDDAPVFSEAMRRGNVGLTVLFPEEHRGAVEAALGGTPIRSYEELRASYEAEGWRHDETPEERAARIQREQEALVPPFPPRPF